MQLEKLLNEHDLLKDGHVIALKDGKKISLEDRIGISSILSYMCSSKRSEMIEFWFNSEWKEDWNCYPQELTKQLGFEYVNYWRGRSYGGAWFRLPALITLFLR